MRSAAKPLERPSIHPLRPVILPALVLAAVWAESATAQIEEITVTARRRSEAIQEVPESITAFVADQIENRQMRVIDDVLAATSNVHIVNDQDTATNIITVRGVGTNRNLAASVAFVIDGVVLPDTDAFVQDLADVERIEVLKGPQGALYGKNAIGGAINVTTKRPTTDFEAELKAGYGNGDSVNLFGAVSGPIVGEKVLARFSAQYRESDGFIRNDFDGELLDRNESERAALRVLFQPTERLSVDVRGSYFNQDAGASWYSGVDILGTTGGEITDSILRVNPNQDGPHHTDLQLWEGSVKVDYQIGRGTLTSITAYDTIDVVFDEDLDFTARNLWPFLAQTRKLDSVSEEVRFVSPDDQRLRYIVGAYYQHTNRDFATNGAFDSCFFIGLDLNTFTPCPPLVPSGIFFPLALNSIDGEFDQYAAFAQAAYDLTDDLELSVALRYDRDERTQRDLLGGRVDEASFDDVQPKVSLSYQATQDVLAYLTYAEGFKTGAFNPPPTPASSILFPLVVQPEHSRSLEAGFKSEWNDRRLLFNAAAFYIDYSDIQVFQFDVVSGSVAINADEATIWGVELESAARLPSGFELNAAFGYTNAEFDDFNGTGLHDGNRLPNVPRYTLNVGAEYRKPQAILGAGMTVRAEYDRKGRMHYAEDNLIQQPAFGTVNAFLTFDKGPYIVSLWGKNIFDEDYSTAAFSRAVAPQILGLLGLDVVQLAPGAQYGIEVRIKL